jgi:hypothetical protein
MAQSKRLLRHGMRGLKDVRPQPVAHPGGPNRRHTRFVQNVLEEAKPSQAAAVL